MPIFLLFVILFAMWIRYEIKKNSQIESDNKTSFIEQILQTLTMSLFLLPLFPFRTAMMR